MVRPPAAWTTSAADANSARTNAINAFIRTSEYREDVSYGVTSPDNLHPTFRTIGQTCRRKSKSPWQAVRRLVESDRLRDLPDDATTTRFPFWRNYMSRTLR